MTTTWRITMLNRFGVRVSEKVVMGDLMTADLLKGFYEGQENTSVTVKREGGK